VRNAVAASRARTRQHDANECQKSHLRHDAQIARSGAVMRAQIGSSGALGSAPILGQAQDLLGHRPNTLLTRDDMIEHVVVAKFAHH
jgi:hypothetical protein